MLQQVRGICPSAYETAAIKCNGAATLLACDRHHNGISVDVFRGKLRCTRGAHQRYRDERSLHLAWITAKRRPFHPLQTFPKPTKLAECAKSEVAIGIPLFNYFCAGRCMRSSHWQRSHLWQSSALLRSLPSGEQAGSRQVRRQSIRRGLGWPSESAFGWSCSGAFCGCNATYWRCSIGFSAAKLMTAFHPKQRLA